MPAVVYTNSMKAELNVVVIRNILKVRPFPVCFLPAVHPLAVPLGQKEPGGCSQLQVGPVSISEQYNAKHTGMPDAT